ncbi:MAG: TIGR04086 family membrane protein [Phycisphaerales bacterium]
MWVFVFGTIGVLILGWVWASRGFFSALIHLLCVLIAGAVAFGLWEPIGYAVLGAAGSRKWLIDIAWGISLAVPFAVVLAILRVAIDKALPFNTDLDGTSNLIGGIICGAISGVISIGIVTISVTNMRISTESVKFPMVDYDTNGSIVKQSGWLTIYPRITADLYAFLSRNSMRTQTPLATWRPDIAYEGSMLRTSFNDGTSRFALPPGAVAVEKRYTIGMQETGLEVKSFLSPSQTVTPFDSSNPIGSNDKGYYVEGYVLKFKNSARETDGRVVVGASQVQLIVQSPDETQSKTLFPVALISQSSVKEGDERVRYWRWGFSSPRTYIASVGGADDPPMAVEFLVPKGWKPLSVNVKGLRFLVDDMPPPQQFKDAAQRIEAVKRYEVVALPAGAKGARGPRDWPGGTTGLATAPYRVDTRGERGPLAPINMIDTLPFGLILSADDKRGLKTTGDRNTITEGEARFKNSDLQDMRGTPQTIQMRQIFAEDNTVIVQVNISNDSPIAYTKSKLAIEGIGAPVLVDNLGQRYSAIGYVYQDATSVWIRVTPGQPIGAVADLPDGGPNPSRSDQKFVLIYRVTTNVKITSFNIGTNTVAKIEPPLETKRF